MEKNLEAILAYQDVDMQLRAIEVELEQNEAFVAAAKARQAMRNAKNKIALCEKKAEEILATLARAQSEFNTVNEKIAALKQDVQESDENDDVDYTVGVLTRLQDSSNGLAKEVEELQKQIAEVTRNYNEARESIKRNKTVFEAKKVEYDAFYSTKVDAMKKLQDQLAGMSKGIEASVMEKYAALRREKKMPALQKIIKDGSVYRCPRCRMEVDAATVERIRVAGAGECTTCHFILYMD